MKAYKGFNKDMTCRGFQYEEGKTYECEEAKLCEKGFHACEVPFDVFRYYPPHNSNGFNVFSIVEPNGEIVNGDNKLCGTKIKIGTKIKFSDFIKIGVDFNLQRQGANRKSSSGDCSGASSSGNCSGASSSGDCSGASSSGDCSGASSSGNYSGASSSGDYSGAMAIGDNCNASCGLKSIAVVNGRNGRCKGQKGSVLLLVRLDNERNIEYYKAFRIDGKHYKPDTWYTLDENGKVVEAND